MNAIRQVQELNKRELEAVVDPAGSWHRDYADTAYIYIGGLSFDLSEGDVVTIFSQFGEPVYINLVRDKETGKSRGFAFLKYEDQRSTDLAVDNLGGSTLMGRVLRVDHTRYKKKDDEELVDNTNGTNNDDASGIDEKRRDASASPAEPSRPLLPEERALAALLKDHDDDDPMKDYLVQQKRDELEVALARLSSILPEDRREKKHKHRHRSHRDDDDNKHRRHRSKRDEGDDHHYRSRDSEHHRDKSRTAG